MEFYSEKHFPVCATILAALVPLLSHAQLSCTTPPSGLVAWWPAEGNANDIIGTNNGILQGGIGFASGEIGQAFAFNNTNATVIVPASSSLDVGNGSGLTLEASINPTDVTQDHPLFEWNNTNSWGVHFHIAPGQPFNVSPGPGELYANVVDSNGGWHQLSSSSGVVSSNIFQHVALTYDKASGVATIYCNGHIVSQQNLGSFTPLTSYNLYLGHRPTPNDTVNFAGLMDEPAVYNRALSSNEIAAIYSAGSSGKCSPTPMPPSISSQPTNQTLLAGQTASFNVTASGTAPLSYQWRFGTTNIANATNATLTLTNVQLSLAGNYSVLVTNLLGATNSAAATLTVVVPQCNSAPAGLVSWWPAEGNANDIISGNNGIMQAGVSFASGKVGQAFFLNNTNAYLRVPASASLKNIETGSGLTIEGWIDLTNVAAFHPIAEINDGIGDYGVQFWLGSNPADNGLLYAALVDTNGTYHQLYSPQHAVAANVFQHIAVTYDKTSGVGTLYVNGAVVAQSTWTNFTPQTGYDLWIGHRQGDYLGSWTYGSYLGGLLDELSIYNRGLSSNEIAGIYNAGSAGKCPPPPMPPSISSQPVSRTNIVATTASFIITAGGTQPLSYQWSFNATNIANATNATLTLTNVQLSQAGNYSVVITNAYGLTNSAIAALTIVLPPMIVTQPHSQSVASFQSAAFSVAATGTGPLTYQWRKNGTNLVDGGNITGSITTNLHIAVVTLADAGNYDVVVKNPYATSNSVVALLTVPQTILTFGSTNGISGSTVTVPILMNALGVENALIASVSYQTNKLALQRVQLGQATSGSYFQEVDSQTNIGNVGFAILLNSGGVVPAGTQEVARLVFTALPVTSNAIASLTFGDNPDSRQLADNNGNSLPAIYQGGTVSLTPGEYAADVYPRPAGDHQVTLQDWLEIGRMVARLDTITNSDEFLRADCAPRNAPNGVLTVADWVQAGRYALGLDPLTIVTPPVKSNLKITADDDSVPARTLQLGNISAQRGQTVNVPVQLVCNTNENAVGMTVIYNTNQLQFISASLGSALANGLLNINTNIAPGQCGAWKWRCLREPHFWQERTTWSCCNF